MSETYINIHGETRQVSSMKLPTSGRAFRNAWKFNDDLIEVDMDKAKEIKRNEIRQAREPELKQLDVDYFKAMEQGQDTKPIVEKKQKLRDATKHAAIDNAKTPEELVKITLDDLLK